MTTTDLTLSPAAAKRIQTIGAREGRPLMLRVAVEGGGPDGNSRATLAPDAVAALARYDWPGNVRELQNVMAWMAVHSPGRGRVSAAALPRHVAQVSPAEETSFDAARADFERRFVKAALATADGQRARAAEALGVTRQGLAKMIRRLGLDRE